MSTMPGRWSPPAAGKQVRGVAAYEENLRQLVARLKATGAKLVWGSTTPVPAGSNGRVQGDEAKYNEAAARVMREAGIPIDDLHAVVVSGPADMQLPKNVHFTNEGYGILARAVVASFK